MDDRESRGSRQLTRPMPRLGPGGLPHRLQKKYRQRGVERCFEAKEEPFSYSHIVQIGARDCVVGKRENPYMAMKSGPGPDTV